MHDRPEQHCTDRDGQPACTSAQSVPYRDVKPVHKHLEQNYMETVRPAHDEKETVFDHAVKCEHYHAIYPYIKMNEMKICWCCLRKVKNCTKSWINITEENENSKFKT